MKITYIHHSSFLVELEHVSMLFDYYAGQLPEIRKDRPLVVFASHFHGDHFAPVIFDLAKDREDVNYVLSKDISKKKVPDNLIGRVPSIPKEGKPGWRLKRSNPPMKGWLSGLPAKAVPFTMPAI